MGKRHTIQSVADSLAEQGNRTAILALHQEGTERWSYAKLANHVQGLANGFVKAGMGKARHMRLCWLMRGGLLSNPLEVGFTRDKSLIFPGFKYRMQDRRSRHFGINQQSLLWRGLTRVQANGTSCCR
jgi:hypothetical protein